MPANRGKEWENTFQSLCLQQGIDCVRFYDTLYYDKKGPKNPADFVISRSKKEPSILIECKVCEKSSFNIKSKFKQLPDLLELTKFRSYLVIWFSEEKLIYAIDTVKLNEFCLRGLKTLSPKSVEIYRIPAIKLATEFKRVNPVGLYLDLLW